MFSKLLRPVFGRHYTLLKYHERRNNKCGVLAAKLCTAGLIILSLSVVGILVLSCSGLGICLRQDIYVSGIREFLVTPWFGLLDTLAIVFLGVPFLAWGLASLMGILVGIDINK